MRELGFTESTLETIGYKQTSVMTNMASTLVLPSRVPDASYMVHGAKMVNGWSARSTDGGQESGISLVVSDWGESGEIQVCFGFHFLTKIYFCIL